MADELELKDDNVHDIVPVSGLYENWFLDYASYVILERAVPAIEDGFKPVQRRIMHAMKVLDDGRFNKVANIIGATMQYHPHGDASIGDAIVGLGQKDLLIETQGNWGDTRTGDGAAAPRYIEARLSKFALEVIFNPETTVWQASYDGRKKEPVTLPVKFPLVLAQGVEGIAVGLSTKVLPHNFCELIKASIDVLKGKRPNIVPDFPTGGYMDASNYNDGQRGGKVRVRAKIEEKDKKTLLVKEIPFGTTTSSLIDSIVKANDQGKIKIKKVTDNTAQEVEIEIQLPSGVSPDITIDALYAFTDCEVSISPNCCVIIQDKPHFISVNDLLKLTVGQTKELLRQELEIKKADLMEKLLYGSLEKIFIQNRIYQGFEKCKTFEEVVECTDQGLEPFKKDFYREIVREDLLRLIEIPVKRISLYDSFKAEELMKQRQEELEEVEHHLANLNDYAIAYYKHLLDKYGKGRERKTEIRTFDVIDTKTVVANNEKLYCNYREGFIGYGLKKDEFVMDCSDIDDIIVFMRDGTFKVVRNDKKVFVGKDIIHCQVFNKLDERLVYNLIYLDGSNGRSMVKRFQVNSFTRDKEYVLTKGGKGSKVLYFTANPNGEAEIVQIKLTQSCKARNKIFDFDFATIDIKGRSAGGNLLTKYPVRKVDFKQAGASTLGGIDVYYDATIGRLNTEERGELLGEFLGDDRILVIYKDGSLELTSYDLTNRYEPSKIEIIQRWETEMVVSAIHFDGDNYLVKRFKVETNAVNKPFIFISEENKAKLIVVSTDAQPQIELNIEKGKSKDKETMTLEMDSLIDVKGWKAMGNRLSPHTVKKVKLLPPKEQPKKEEKEQFTAGDSIDLDVDSKPTGKQIDLF